MRPFVHSIRETRTLALLASMAGMAMAGPAFSHGSMETPASRVYNCYMENPENPTSAACQAAARIGGSQSFYDWNAVNQGNANGRHRDVVPDGRLCSGGKALHRGLDLARDDWPSTTLAPDSDGNFEFVYRATQPHATQRFTFYVTADGYDPTQALTWSDLESRPFCDIRNARLGDKRYYMTCPLPRDKSGRHVIYNIWQRSDSAEAFYACIDVVFAGGAGGIVTEWRELGQVLARNDLSRGSQARLRLFNAAGQDRESHSLNARDGRIAAADWPLRLAEVVNGDSNDIRVGVLGDDGRVTPTRGTTANRVYTKSNAALSFEIDITEGTGGNTGGGNPNTGGGTTGGGNPNTGGGNPDPARPASGEAWQAGLTYVARDQVTHKGGRYRAKWWTRGDEPVVNKDAPWKTPWELVSGTGNPVAGSGGTAWRADKAYVAGDVVSHKGTSYRAKWWTRGFAPDKAVKNSWDNPWQPAG